MWPCVQCARVCVCTAETHRHTVYALTMQPIPVEGEEVHNRLKVKAGIYCVYVRVIMMEKMCLCLYCWNMSTHATTSSHWGVSWGQDRRVESVCYHNVCECVCRLGGTDIWTTKTFFRHIQDITRTLIKGELCSYGEKIQTHKCNIYNITEVIIQTQKYIFHKGYTSSEENKVPELCLKLERWQGPPHINKVKQYGIVLSFKVSLFI